MAIEVCVRPIEGRGAAMCIRAAGMCCESAEGLAEGVVFEAADRSAMAVCHITSSKLLYTHQDDIVGSRVRVGGTCPGL